MLSTKVFSSPVFRQQETSTSGPPLQKQVAEKVHDQWDHDKVSQQVKQAGHSVLLAEEGATGPVHVELRTPKIIDGNHTQAVSVWQSHPRRS
jgi:hypothetical protein